MTSFIGFYSLCRPVREHIIYIATHTITITYYVMYTMCLTANCRGLRDHDALKAILHNSKDNTLLTFQITYSMFPEQCSENRGLGVFLSHQSSLQESTLICQSQCTFNVLDVWCSTLDTALSVILPCNISQF